jgi:hypothetical protein
MLDKVNYDVNVGERDFKNETMNNFSKQKSALPPSPT